MRTNKQEGGKANRVVGVVMKWTGSDWRGAGSGFGKAKPWPWGEEDSRLWLVCICWLLQTYVRGGGAGATGEQALNKKLK